jgi:hypothetical protein
MVNRITRDSGVSQRPTNGSSDRGSDAAKPTLTIDGFGSDGRPSVLMLSHRVLSQGAP